MSKIDEYLESARAAVQPYTAHCFEERDVSQYIIIRNLLTDLEHYCNDIGLDFEHAKQYASLHYNEEMNEILAEAFPSADIQVNERLLGRRE